jgi:RHS repeat-associated protein
VLDGRGTQAGRIDPLSNVQRTLLDANGQNIGSLDARGGVPQTVLDGSGATRLVVDAVGNETRYVVDGDGRQSVEFDPLGKALTTSYDAVGRATKVVDRLGREDDFNYDAGDRLTLAVWKNASGTTVNLLTYTFDNDNNLLSAADHNGTVTYGYDELNRARSYTNVFGQVLTYTRDALDHVTQRTDSLGGTLTSVYDAAGRLGTREFSGTDSAGAVVRVDFGYSVRNELTSITRSTNLAGTAVLATSTYGHDDATRLTSITNKNSSAVTLSYYNYGYDTSDRVTTQTWWSQIGTTVYSGTRTYVYDSTSQLTNDGTTGYSYDLNGNRTMTGYQTGTGNRLSNDGVFTYTFDAAGNLIQKSKGSGQETWYYGYDNANQLLTVRKTSDGSTNTLLVTYTYDVQGQRVQQDKWVSGGSTVTTRFAFDGANVWADLDNSNTMLVRYLNGDGANQVLARTVASGVNAGRWVYFADMLGSIRDLADTTGAVKDHLDYDGFGVVTESTASVGDRFQFQGGNYDSNTGQVQYDHRYYAAATGNWDQPDPIGFRAGDPNLFRFVGNNPANVTDPTGLDRLWLISRPWYPLTGLVSDVRYLVFPERSRSNIASPISPKYDPDQTNRPGLKAGDIIDSDTKDWKDRATQGLKSALAEGGANAAMTVGPFAMAKGKGNISNDYLDKLRRKNPKATKEQLCEMLRLAYEAARKKGDSKLAATIKLAQKALGCRQTHYD